MIDEAIRHQRTVREAQMIHAARQAGLDVPRLYYVDPPEATIVMEYVEGDRVKDVIGVVPSREAVRIFRGIGEGAARLHASKIVHGDLTTANVVLREGRLAYLDFGLSTFSTRVEDFAVDLRLIKETVVGAHSQVGALAIKSLLEGYASAAGERKAKAVLNQLRGIERRGRYARVD